jgi:hypothetical protein
MEGIIGLLLLLIFLALTGAFAAWRVGERVRLRPLAALQTLLPQVSRAIESGGALHVSIGSGGVGGADTLNSLAGATVLANLADAAAAAGVAPLVTVADPTLLPVAQDTLRRAFARRGRADDYRPDQVLLFSPQPAAYAAAAMGVAEDSATSGNVFVGSFGPEVALLAEAAARRGMTQIAGAAEPQAQAVLYPTADFVLYGEEIFATGAYLGDQAAASRLVAFDVVRLLVIAAILVLALLQVLTTMGLGA